MSDRCANPSCFVSRDPHTGKLFCTEIEISNTAAVLQRRTAYIWLCDGCARQMKAESEIAGEVIRGLLAASANTQTPISSAVN
jgi:hypothetical protein